MADVTVAQFAEVLKIPVDKLLVQLDQAGIKVSGPGDKISDDSKMLLLTHLRRSHGAAPEASGAAAPRKITLQRKQQSEIKLAGGAGRARTVNVEVRVKRTYVKRDVLEEQNKGQVDEVAEAKRREAEEAQRAEKERQENERREAERIEADNRRRIEEEAAARRAADEARQLEGRRASAGEGQVLRVPQRREAQGRHRVRSHGRADQDRGQARGGDEG